MKKIILVRHGQASFGKEHYDQLSDKGYAQSELLGRHWKTQTLSPSHWVCGQLARQTQTLKAIQQGLGHQGLDQQVPGKNGLEQQESTTELNNQHTSLEQLNEFPAEAITKHYLPQVIAKENNPQLTQDRIFSDNLIFQKVFSKVIKCWLTEKTHIADTLNFESWNEYQARAKLGIDKIIELANTEDAPNASSNASSKANSPLTPTVVVTSAGFIAACVIKSTQDSAQSISSEMFKLAWNITNASVTELQVNHGRFYLHSFNNYAHLTHDSDLVTYR